MQVNALSFSPPLLLPLGIPICISLVCLLMNATMRERDSRNCSLNDQGEAEAECRRACLRLRFAPAPHLPHRQLVIMRCQR